MSFTTKSRCRKNRVPPDAFTGIRTSIAAMAIGPNIFNLAVVNKKATN